MIIETLLSVILRVFDLLLTPIQIPSLDAEVMGFFEQGFEFMLDGLLILGNFVDLEYLSTLLAIVIVIELAIHVYHFVMWILRKIPMLGIE